MIQKNSHNEVYFRDVQRAWSDYYGTQKWTEQRSLWLKTESEFESALAAYDNFGFLLLSITALVSSTIVGATNECARCSYNSKNHSLCRVGPS